MKCRKLHADIQIDVDKNNRLIHYDNANTYILGLNEVKTTHQLPKYFLSHGIKNLTFQ